jgi:transposase InsO family protein
MQEDGLQARIRKRFKCTTMSDHDQPVAANLLDRQFTAEAPNQRWVGDTTEFVIGESGKLYLAVILDLFSRFVVGWAISAVNDRHLTLKALGMALKRRCPDVGLLHRSRPGGYSSLTRLTIVVPGASYEVALSSIAIAFTVTAEFTGGRSAASIVHHGKAAERLHGFLRSLKKRRTDEQRTNRERDQRKPTQLTCPRNRIRAKVVRQQP